MLNSRENIWNHYFDSIIVFAIVFLGLLVYSNSVRRTAVLKRNPVSTYISVSEKNADFSPYVRLQVFQKTCISNKDHFNLLAFNWNQVFENKKSDLKVSYLQIIRQSSNKIPLFILRYHLFPDDSDEPPLLS
jgi:aminopeptidase-like protein